MLTCRSIHPLVDKAHDILDLDLLGQNQERQNSTHLAPVCEMNQVNDEWHPWHGDELLLVQCTHLLQISKFMA